MSENGRVKSGCGETGLELELLDKEKYEKLVQDDCGNVRKVLLWM